MRNRIEPSQPQPQSTKDHSTTAPIVRAHQQETCPTCGGAGIVAVPDLTGMSLSDIARGSGRSPALISRMLSDDPKQKRPNPTLDTMKEICRAIEESTGVPYSLDQLARAIE